MKKYLERIQTFSVYVFIFILIVLSIDNLKNGGQLLFGKKYSWVTYILITGTVYGIFEVLVRIRKKDKREFIAINIPNNIKDLFVESLRAFESYSKLSGYEVKFSFDNSEKDKLGFKFTVTENPNNISNDEIRTDIKEFLEKIQKGEKFDDLPVIINPFEHQMVLTILKNRVNFIEHSYNLEKNMRELYEKAIKDLLNTKNLFSQQPMTVNNNNYLQSGGENNSKQIEALQSKVNMGDGNFIEDNSINIQHSFNEKKTIIEKTQYGLLIMKKAYL